METGLVQILEGALLAAGEPLSVQRMTLLFEENERPTKDEIKAAIESVEERCEGRGYELVHVASGYRFQVRQDLAQWVGRLWQERPARYSRALMETLSLIAYRQPITRGEIEEIRGVAVSTNIIKTLLEREWVRVVGHRDVPGRPPRSVLVRFPWSLRFCFDVDRAKALSLYDLNKRFLQELHQRQEGHHHTQPPLFGGEQGDKRYKAAVSQRL